jgi:hypothetical protein
MKLKYITLITKRDDPYSYPRAHLRWMELDDKGLKFGFSSESVVVRGKNLNLLMRDVVTGRTEEIQERPERPVEPDKWEVHQIGTPFEESASQGDAKPKDKK